MPAILIEVRKDYNEEEGTKIIDAVHSAMVTAFQIPSEDKTVRLLVHPPHRFAVSPTKSKPELYTWLVLMLLQDVRLMRNENYLVKSQKI